LTGQLNECPDRETLSDRTDAKPLQIAPDTQPATDAAACPDPPIDLPPPVDALLEVSLEMQLAGVLLKQEDVVRSSMLPYLCEVASLLEGRSIARGELIAALLKRMRQRSIHQLTRRAYVLHYLNQHPP
jgi:hypothetical protein